MANTFSVDDTSPVIAYLPFADTITNPNPPPTPNLTAGWNPYIVNFGFATSPGLSAPGQTQHITSRDNASLTLLWHGTSIQLFGNTTSQASFSLQLDDVAVQPNTTSPSNNLLALFDGLADTDHRLVLTANIPEPEAQDPPSLLVFDSAVIKSPPPEDFSNITFSDHLLPDNNIAFQGQWTLMTSTQPPTRLSGVQGEFAEATFSGISVRIFGTTSPTSGNYSVTLDGTQTPILSAKSSFVNPSVLLFFASGLEANTSHHIQLRNEGGGSLSLNSDTGFDILSSGDPTALPPSDNGPPASGNTGNTTLPLPPNSPVSGASTNSGFAKGTIAALVLSGFLAFILLTCILFYFCVWRPRKQKRRQQHAREMEYGYTPAGAMRQRYPRNPRRDSLYPREKEQEPIVANGERGEEGVLDIGHEDRNQPDDAINTSPPLVHGTNSGSENSNAAPNDGRSRRVSNRSGFARWKRDVNTLSGLTTLGLKFRHSDSAGDEKSPGSPSDFIYSPYGDVDIGHGHHGGSSGSGDGGNNGFIYGRYDPEVDGGLVGAGGDDAGGVRRLNTRSSGRSLRFGRKRSNNGLTPKNSKGKGKLPRVGSSGFSFRLSPHSRYGDSSGSHPDNYDPYHDLPPQEQDPHPKPEGNGDRAEVESLSGLTSLSYASNPHAAVYLNAQPPSYAASVSQSNGTSSPPSVPRSVTRSPQSQSRNTSAPPSPLDAQGPGLQHDFPIPVPLPVPITHISSPRQPRPLPQKPESQPHLPSQTQQSQPQPSSSRRTRSTDDTEVHDTGRHILSIGGGLAGVGGPISVRAAIRGLSPRISKSRRSTEGRSKKGKEKERHSGRDQLEREREVQLEREKQRQEREEKEREQQPRGEPSHSGAVSGEQEQRIAENLPPPPSISTTLLQGQGSRTGSPVRALPPIPIPPVPSSQSQLKQALPQKDISPTSGGKPQRKQPPRDPGIPSEPPSASYLSIHPASPLKLDFDHLTGTASTSVVTSSSSSPTTSSSEKRFKGRSSLGDAAGLGSPGAVQSFAEAAAIAATPNVAGGASAGMSASEVHVGEGSSGAPVADGDERGRSGSRRQSGASRVHFEDDTTSTSASPTNMEAAPAKHEKGREGKGKGKEKAQKKDETKWRFRLTPPSGQSPTSIEAPSSDSEVKPAADPPADTANRSFLEFNSNPPSLHSRRTSEQLGQEHTSDSGDQNRIWSMQLPGRDLVPPVPPISSTGLKSKWSNTTMQTSQTQSSSTDSGNGSEAQHLGVVQEVSRRSNIFPFPLAIPPSPNMPEGFTGVEPSPSLMSPTASLPVPGASRKKTHRKHPQAHSAVPTGVSSGKSEDAADAGGTESPTDSFPYSISDIHFRNSLLGSDSDQDLEPGQVQFARRRSLTHPPLPSTPLTPQRFNPGQEQQRQQHSASSSIVQRVFGSRSGSAAARTPPPGGSS